MERKELVQQCPVWLTTSCFCSREEWNIVLKEINEIVKNLKDELLRYHIQFNKHYGDNIRISFLTKEERIDKVGQKVTLCFEPLFSSFPKEIFKSPIDNIILPFPTNIFDFGLYKITFSEKFLPTYKVQEALSDAMIAVLSKEEITQDTLLTFVLYLRVSLFKACSKFLNKTEKWSLLRREESASNTSFPPIQKANMDLVFEITREIMENEKFEDELEWLDKWYNECNILIEDSILALNDKVEGELEKVIKEFYQESIYFIFVQIGLSELEIRFTERLINYSLNSVKIKVITMGAELG